jgi:hypothetical protein
VMSEDDVKLGDLTAKGVTFGEATSLKGISFLAAKFDGILGLAFDSISVNHVEPIFYSLVRQHQVQDASFSFYLTKKPNQEGSQLIMGGVENQYARSPFKYYDLVMLNYWLIRMTSLSFGDFKIDENLMAIVDTGTSVIVGPKDIVNKIISQFPPKIECANIDTYPNLVFTIGQDLYTIEPINYILNVMG